MSNLCPICYTANDYHHSAACVDERERRLVMLEKKEEAKVIIEYLQNQGHNAIDSLHILELARGAIEEMKEQHKHLIDIERYKRRGF